MKIVLHLHLLYAPVQKRMKLVIDQGNSFTKIAFFKGSALFWLQSFENAAVTRMIDAIGQKIAEFEPKTQLSGIYSTVSSTNEALIEYLQPRIQLLHMSPHIKSPLTNSYQTPHTLGNDRIAAAVAGSALHPNNTVLCIDAGTCITYDLVTNAREYLGGGIAPGISMRFRAMHTFTGNLPLVPPVDDVPLIGKTTETALQSGVINGVVAEMDGIIGRYQQDYPSLKTILSGGDANYFDKKLKKHIFAVPNLVLMGLKDLLEYNVER